MGGLSGVFSRVGDLVGHPLTAAYHTITNPKKGIKEFEHLYTHNEHEDQKMFNGLGIHGWVGKHPQETAAAVVGTIFGGWAAWGAYGAGAAGGATAGATTAGASTAAPISAASGTLTSSGVAMGGQSAVDANMVAGAGSETALGNLFEGFGGSNVVGNAPASSWMDYAKKANQVRSLAGGSQQQQAQQQPLRAGQIDYEKVKAPTDFGTKQANTLPDSTSAIIGNNNQQIKANSFGANY